MKHRFLLLAALMLAACDPETTEDLDGGPIDSGDRDAGRDAATPPVDAPVQADVPSVLDSAIPFDGGIDAFVPGSVRFTAPAADATVTELPLVVTAVLDPEGTLGELRIELDGVEIATAEDALTIEASIITLSAGVHTLRVVAIDAAGLSSEASLDFSYDAEAPTLLDVSPIDGASVYSRVVRIEGSVSDDVGVAALTIAFDGATAEPLVVESDGSFAGRFDAAPGPGTFTLTATDDAGRETTTTRAFHYGHRISGGGSHTGFIDGNALYIWGRNNIGQVGTGSTSTAGVTSPYAHTTITDAVSVVARQNASVVLRADGTLLTFGTNGDGQLGLGMGPTDSTPAVPDTTNRSAPTAVPSISSAIAVAAGYNHTLVLLDDGSVLSFGDNASGQLGDGVGVVDRSWAAPVVGLSDIVQIAAGSQHSLALTRDGHVFAWGRNTYGTLGAGAVDSGPHSTPTLVPGLDGVVMLASGRDHVLALRDDGSVMSWGLDASGQLGNDTAEADQSSPVAVMRDVEGVVSVLTGVRSVHADGNMSYVLLEGGLALSWGQGFNGQLGLGDQEDRPLPSTAILVLLDVLDLDPGATHVHALVRGTGTSALYGWGWSFQGSLGLPTALTNWSYPSPLLIPVP